VTAKHNQRPRVCCCLLTHYSPSSPSPLVLFVCSSSSSDNCYSDSPQLRGIDYPSVSIRCMIAISLVFDRMWLQSKINDLIAIKSWSRQALLGGWQSRHNLIWITVFESTIQSDTLMIWLCCPLSFHLICSLADMISALNHAIIRVRISSLSTTTATSCEIFAAMHTHVKTVTSKIYYC